MHFAIYLIAAADVSKRQPTGAKKLGKAERSCHQSSKEYMVMILRVTETFCRELGQARH